VGKKNSFFPQNLVASKRKKRGDRTISSNQMKKGTTKRQEQGDDGMRPGPGKQLIAEKGLRQGKGQASSL